MDVLGHRDRRSVERYARLADEALIAVLRPLRPTPESDASSPACRQGQERHRKASNRKRKWWRRRESNPRPINTNC
jgi:hypothetical protein